MRNFKNWLLVIVGLLYVGVASAYKAPEKERPKGENTAVSFREDCTTAEAQTDQATNNVRARLTTGGDVWWDRNNGIYIVPKVEPGEDPVSSIFAGAVWLGGFDPGGNLKTACQTYGNGGGNSDFFAGPITPDEGTTSKDTCEKWDRFFKVTADEIFEHLFRYGQLRDNNVPYTEDQIPFGVKAWPARGNPFFAEVNNFELPNTTQGLAGYWDEDEDGIYNPLNGDYPIIEIRGCEEAPPPPDEMIFWIYNDAGGAHGETQGVPIRMEVQVQAFAYATNDEVNDMTFQRYKLINRAKEDIDSTFFAMWVDADLGCFLDDYVGCDTARSFAYIYNEDAADGQPGTSCQGGVGTYGTNIPIVGVDYFRGPLDEFRNEIGMSSFTYYNNGGFNSPPPGTTDPNVAAEFYNYLSGSWVDGSPFTFGDDAYQDGEPINYAFTDAPNDPNGWSMCTANLPPYDRRTIQASGPFTLQPGAVNELIVGVVWVPDFDYPCPDISRILFADDIAQALFDGCFKFPFGPDAPDVDWIELDREIIAVLTNDTSQFVTNNAFEEYTEEDVRAPAEIDLEDKMYDFEGYLLYQIKGPTVSTSDLDDPDKARLIHQVDIKNEVQRLFNWRPADAQPVSVEETVWLPTEMVNGQNDGIRHTFRITEDAFAEGDRRLINHRKYYFRALAYGFNEFDTFDPFTGVGQKTPFLAGRRRIGERPDGDNDYYTVIPRPITDITLNSQYGDGPEITRIDGVGAGSNFLDVTAESRDRMISGDFDGTITYNAGRGPIEVEIYNPLEVIDGEYELTFIDENMGNDELDSEVRWQLTNLSNPGAPIVSQRTIEQLNDEILGEFGFRVAIAQSDDVGDNADRENGAIGQSVSYSDSGGDIWFEAINDEYSVSDPTFLETLYPVVFNFASTGNGENDNYLDLFQSLTNIDDGYFSPYLLHDFRNRGPGALVPFYYSAAWRAFGGIVASTAADSIGNLNNVDIVFTSNKDLWSRCIVLETRTDDYDSFGRSDGSIAGGQEIDGQVRGQLQLRNAPSVGKEDTDGDGLPDPDGDGKGMGWFPGYAVDVETGERLNIFFGENTAYSPEDTTFLPLFAQNPTGRDMMFNPTDQVQLFDQQVSPFSFYAGGQHWIYVTNQRYDGCAAIRPSVDPDVPGTPLEPRKAFKIVTWTSLPIMASGTSMNSYAEGLIPNDATVKLRVDNPYEVKNGTGDFNGYPTYRFRLDGVQADELDEPATNEALAAINVVPNPYYAYSAYENGQNVNTVKIVNLPAKCTVTIYSLDGKFIRRYERDELPGMPKGDGITTDQILPDIEWDMKNNKGIPIASGVYLIHVDARAQGWGERTLKWFGINRQFDPNGL